MITVGAWRASPTTRTTEPSNGNFIIVARFCCYKQIRSDKSGNKLNENIWNQRRKRPILKKKYWRSFISCAADRNRWETFPRLAYFVWLYFCVIVVVFPWFSLFPFFTQRIMLIYVVLFISQTVSVFLSVHNDRESLSMFALWRIFLPFPFSWCFSWRK